MISLCFPPPPSPPPLRNPKHFRGKKCSKCSIAWWDPDTRIKYLYFLTRSDMTPYMFLPALLSYLTSFIWI